MARGRRGRMPRLLRMSTATSAEATPRGPSNSPPPGTESRWLPVTTASALTFVAVSHQAHRIPFRLGADVQSAPGGLLNEPAPQVRFRGGKHRAGVAAAFPVGADAGDVPHQAGYGGGCRCCCRSRHGLVRFCGGVRGDAVLRGGRLLVNRALAGGTVPGPPRRRWRGPRPTVRSGVRTSRRGPEQGERTVRPSARSMRKSSVGVLVNRQVVSA